MNKQRCQCIIKGQDNGTRQHVAKEAETESNRFSQFTEHIHRKEDRMGLKETLEVRAFPILDTQEEHEYKGD